MSLGKRNSSHLGLNLERRTDGKITNVRTLLEKLGSLNLGKNDGVTFFRGHANQEWSAEPSIYRHNSFIKNEDIIFREIISSIPEEFSLSENTFQKLVKMQHYGLPTRLLDITENPLIALYFACIDKNFRDKDGEILVYKASYQDIKYFDSDTVSILSNIAKMKYKFQNPENIDILLHEIRQEKNGFLPNINPNDLSKVLFVKPLLDNQRIIRQDGAFMLFGIDEDKSEMAKISDDYKVQLENKGFIIDAGSKNKILKELEVLGIHHAKLFPEIDKIAEHIGRKYLK